MNERHLHQTLSDLHFEERAPFFEDAVMAKLAKRSRRPQPLLIGAMSGLLVITGLSFAVPEISPLHVNAHAGGPFTVTQADVFNFALTGKLRVDDSKSQFVELTSEGDVVAISPDSPRIRFHDVQSFYRMLNANAMAMQHFDSLLEACAMELSTHDIAGNSSALGTMLFGMNQRLSGEIIHLSSGSFPLYFTDSLSRFFREALQERLVRTEDSLIAAATDSLGNWTPEPTITSGELTERPKVHQLHGTSLPDSLKAVRNRV